MLANGIFDPGRPAWALRAALGFALAAGVIGVQARAQAQALPGLPAASAKDKGKGKTEGPAETVATASGPIKVENTAADDEAVEKTLEALLPQYPGVRNVDATVKKGVVTLDGQVDDDDTRNQMTDVGKQVEGVRLVINRLATDAEVLTAPQLVMEQMRAIWGVVSRRWLLAILALGVVMAFAGLARVFNAYSELLLAPFVKNVMLRSVVGSLISSAIILGGMMFGLSILNLTHAVLSVLGLAGVVGLAVGFAFKDIAENFIASVLLGVRRPFRVGDYVTVAGQTGVVRSLNTRATVLVTLEGNHIRIPNNIIYKEILVNATASPSYRASFDVVIPYEASTAAATEAMAQALRGVDGVLADPPARALVEALEPGGVRLRAYYWVPVQGADWFKIGHDAKLRVKVGLQQARVFAPPAPADVAAASAAPASTGGQAAAPRDAAPTGHPNPMERALNQAETRVSEEGTNLLATAGKK
jgi:small-conductance mechanosensitive channel